MIRSSFPIFFAGCFFLACNSSEPHERMIIADRMEKNLRHGVLDYWYPQSCDTLYGGFFSTYTYDFQLTDPQDKMIVTQARHTWANAKAALRYPEINHYEKSARQGFRFLRDFMWDSVYGGFHSLTDRQGNPKSRFPDEKTAYGNSFGIYGLATYYMATKDPEGLELAKKAFYWLEKHSHDPVQGGYFQHMHLDGTPVIRTSDMKSTAETGYKDHNSSIHLLEAFTELYQVWPDPLLRERLEEMLKLLRDKITTEKGYLTLFFYPDWTPVSFRDSSEEIIMKHRSLDHVSYGHDVETAYLMIEASRVLGLKNDERTMTVAKRMVDHALRNGWDNEKAGFYDEGYYFKGEERPRITRDTKNWWSQAEGMNALLLMADLYPDDEMEYYDKFKKLWEYIQANIIDHENGDWFAGGIDRQPELKTVNKGHIWKGIYHHYRALSNCIDMLRGVEEHKH